ncbi:MAG: ribosome maturation factor RimP [Oscillospiraceae bacterium]|nr:ribosome maturation factor RimP [Oscillospiraceae bacterium]
MKSSKKDIEEIVRFLIKEIVANLGFELWNVEYYSEADEWFLEITIDRINKSSGGVSIDDCETVTHAVTPVIDAADPIENSYSLIVSSPGLNRELKNEFHVNRYINKMVSVKLFSKNENLSLLNTDGKNFTGILKEKADDAMTFEVCKMEDKQSKTNKQKNKNNNIINNEQKNSDGINNIITLVKKDIAHIYAYDEIDI